MRIALIHALAHSPPPIEAAFARLWPEVRRTNLLDDSLSADLARDGALTPAMTERFLTLARYAANTGADAILFTCSAFGPCIEACAEALAPMPVLKPNEAMIEEALALAGPTGRIGLIEDSGAAAATAVGILDDQRVADTVGDGDDTFQLSCRAFGKARYRKSEFAQSRTECGLVVNQVRNVRINAGQIECARNARHGFGRINTGSQHAGDLYALLT